MRPWKCETPILALIWYLKGSIQALDPQSVHVGVGNVMVIDQLHLDSVIPRSDLYVVPILVIVHVPWGLFFIIRVTVRW